MSATGATADEAYRQLATLLLRQLQQGTELRTLNVPASAPSGPGGGWLPNDELTVDWIQLMQHYGAECDAADRQRLEPAPDLEETPS